MRTTRRLAGTLVPALTAFVVAAPPVAAAAPTPYVDDPPPEAFTDCEDLGFPVVVDGVFTGRERFIERRGGPPHYQAHYRDELVYTNTLNDKTFTLVYNGLNKDQDIAVNDDGTLTITVKVVQRLVVTGPEGEVLFRTAGQLRYRFDVDYNGTLDDPTDDVEIEDSFAPVKDFVGHDPTRDRSFCEDLATFIG